MEWLKMEWVKLGIDAINALAWPCVALVALLSFRKPVIKLLNPRSVTKFKVSTAGLELERDVSRRLSEVRGILGSSEPSVAGVAPARRAGAEPEVVRAIKYTAELDPTAAVLAAARWYERELPGGLRSPAASDLAHEIAVVTSAVREHPNSIHLTAEDALTYAWGVHTLVTKEHRPTPPAHDGRPTPADSRHGTTTRATTS